MLSRWMSVIFDYAISMKNVSTVWKQRRGRGVGDVCQSRESPREFFAFTLLVLITTAAALCLETYKKRRLKSIAQ